MYTVAAQMGADMPYEHVIQLAIGLFGAVIVGAVLVYCVDLPLALRGLLATGFLGLFAIILSLVYFAPTPWLMLTTAIAFAGVVPLKILWRNPRFCYGCGYDLTGNVTGQCPECGKWLNARQRERAGGTSSPPEES